jgi:hypothetical protein
MKLLFSALEAVMTSVAGWVVYNKLCTPVQKLCPVFEIQPPEARSHANYQRPFCLLQRNNISSLYLQLKLVLKLTFVLNDASVSFSLSFLFKNGVDFQNMPRKCCSLVGFMKYTTKGTCVVSCFAILILSILLTWLLQLVR